MTGQDNQRLKAANPLAKKTVPALPLVFEFVGPDKKFKGQAALQRSHLVSSLHYTPIGLDRVKIQA